MSLKRNLKLVFNLTALDNVRFRFAAKSLDGGSGWGVYDRKTGRFLKNKEIGKLTDDQLAEQFSN